MTKRICARCGSDPARYPEQVGADWYCHPDQDNQTCYEKTKFDQRLRDRVDTDAVILRRLGGEP